MMERTYSVKGMTCEHCVRSVREEVSQLAGVSGVDVDLAALAVAQDGLRLVVDRPALRQGHLQQLTFQILDDRGQAIREFDVEHTKRMHLIVIRRDLTGFQHLHPRIEPDGTWRIALRLPNPGSYRVFADFSHDRKATTLASDLRVDGYANLQALPPSAASAISSDGYDVSLRSSSSRAGQESELSFAVTEHGRPVLVQPYLGADGHLVALRDGDLAFLHVHPTDHRDRLPGGRPDTGIRFETAFPTAGKYRLFLQFKHDRKVHTVAFTKEVT